MPNPYSSVVLHPPGSSLVEGGLFVLRSRPGVPGRVLAAGEGEDGKELWTSTSGTVLAIRDAFPEGSEIVLVLNLRSAFMGESESYVTVEVELDGVSLGTYRVGSQEAQSKLLCATRRAHGTEPVTIAIRAVGAVADPLEISNFQESERPVVEVSAIKQYDSLDAYLAEIQAVYDAAAAFRDELLERDLLPLEDRGELVDHARRTLERLEEREEREARAEEVLREFLADEHVRARPTEGLTIDRAFHARYPERIREGLVQASITKWRRELERFHRGVLHLGNRLFLEGKKNVPGKVARREGELLAHLDRLEFPEADLRRLKDLNLELNGLEILLRRTTLESVVPDLEIELTSYCNYSCVMCGHGGFLLPYDQQDDRALARLLPVMPYIDHVTICGVGETTSTDHLFTFARMLEVHRCDSRLFTNGTFIDRQLDALPRFTRICVSFDGASAETFQTQRRGSNFRRVVDNVARLRRAAPSTILAFSVVVTRLNYKELPEIVLLAADLGVECIAFSPAWHNSPLAIRPSDQEGYGEVLAEAKRLAKYHGIDLQNNVYPEDFHVHADQPFDMAEVRAFTSGMKIPARELRDLDELRREFETLSFSYYPEASLFPGDRWPEAGNVPAMEETPPRSLTAPFDLDGAIERTAAGVRALRAELDAQPRERIKIPYCLSTWGYTYMRASGKNKVCAQTNINVGDVHREGYREVANSRQNQAFRETMFEGPLHDICKTCMDPYRFWGHERLVKLCRKLRLDPVDLTKIKCPTKAEAEALFP